MMLAHPWRGNVRELENSMHRAVLLAQDGVITPDSILLRGASTADAEQANPQNGQDRAATPLDGAGEPATPAAAVPLVGRTVAEVERVLILDTLSHTLGNRTHAATILGISIRTLRNKLKLYSQEGTPITMPGMAERTPA